MCLYGYMYERERAKLVSLLVVPCTVLFIDFRHSQGILIIKFVIQKFRTSEHKSG